MEETFGKYRLIERIGKGGMAEVFLATQIGDLAGFQKQVALKTMSENLSDHEELVIMFLDEARIAAQLNHPNIVHVYDLGRVDDTLYIAMEYVEGKDLRRICEEGVEQDNFLPMEYAVRIIADAAAGLHYAHEVTDSQGQPRNIVHRDVTPQNILVSVDGQVKVADFGVAKAEDRLGHTRVGQRKGKLSYMSPEQLEADSVDARSDVYALGILLYEVTVQSRLFRGRSDFETMSLIANSIVTPPSEVRPDFPPELEAIILKALQKELDDRYQSAQDLQTALEDWLHKQDRRVGGTELAAYMRELFPPEAFPKPPAAAPPAASEQGGERTMISSMAEVMAAEDALTRVYQEPPAGQNSSAAHQQIPAPAAASPQAPPGAARGSSSPAPSPQAAAPAPISEPASAPAAEDNPPDRAAWAVESIEDAEDFHFSDRRTYLWVALGLIAAVVALGFGAKAILDSKDKLDSRVSTAGQAREEPEDDPEAGKPEPVEQVEVLLDTEPSGARVVVNGLAVEGQTPGHFKLVSGEVNEVVFYHPEFPARRVELEGQSNSAPDAVSLEPYESEPETGALEIQSEPAGGIVYINGERIGGAPQVLEDLPVEFSHHVEVRKAEHWSFAGYFDLRAGERNAFRVRLEPEDSPGAVDRVEVTYDILPQYSEVEVNGQVRGFSRLSVREPREELLTVKMSNEHHDSQTRRILTQGIGTFTLRSFLSKTEGVDGGVKLVGAPADSTIYLNARSYQKVPVEVSIPQGDYPLVLETADGARYEHTLKVYAGLNSTYRLSIEEGELEVDEVD